MINSLLFDLSGKDNERPGSSSPWIRSFETSIQVENPKLGNRQQLFFFSCHWNMKFINIENFYIKISANPYRNHTHCIAADFLRKMMNKKYKIAVGATLSIFIAALAASLFFIIRPEYEPPALVFLCGSGMKAPATEIAKQFEQQTGVRVQIHYEGSSILRDYILLFKSGDIFLPGDRENLDLLAAKGLVRKKAFIAWHKAAILVAPRLNGKITCLDDLAKPGLRIALSNPGMASLGRLVMSRILEHHPAGRAILKNIKVYGSCSQDVLELYRKGNIDALIEWDVMARTREGRGLTVIPIQDKYQIKDPLYAALLATTKKPVQTERFYKFLTTWGRRIFKKYGYDIKG